MTQHKDVRYCLMILLLIVLMAASTGYARRRIRILPVGDSNTAAFQGMASYRYFLWSRLVDSGFVDRVDFVGPQCKVGLQSNLDDPCLEPKHTHYKGYLWDWDHAGFHGAGTNFNDVDDWLHTFNPDILLTHLGTNDIFPNRTPPETSVHNIRQIIDGFRSANPSTIVLLAQIIPMRTADSAKVPVLNQQYALLAQELSTPQSPVLLVDQFSDINPRTDLAPDGVHLAETGEIKMANRWFETLLPLLKQLSTVSVALDPLPGGSSVPAGVGLTLNARATCFAGIQSVSFRYNGAVLGTGTRVNDSLFTLQWTPHQTGSGALFAVATDSFGLSVSSEPVLLTISPATITPLTIMQIQGSGWVSPHRGTRVRTSGVVTALTRDSLSFWIQDPTGDGRSSTSDAVFVHQVAYGEHTPPVSTGDRVEITALVEEHAPCAGCETVTRLVGADTIPILSRNNPLPQPVPLNALSSHPSSLADIKAGYERVEGMLISTRGALVASATDSAGRWAIALPGNLSGSGLFPGAHGPLFQVVPHNSGQIDNQAECLLIGSRTLEVAPLVTPGDSVYGLTGVVHYESNGHYVIHPLPESLAVSPPRPFPQSPVGGAIAYPWSIRVVSFNLGDYYDTLDHTLRSDPVTNAERFLLQTGKIEAALVNELFLPEMVCFQGVESRSLLESLARSLNADYGTGYRAIAFESSCPLGLGSGFLVDTTVFGVVSASLMSGTDIDTAFARAGGREPLVGIFRVGGSHVAVVNIDLVDRSADDRLFGSALPARRHSEALRVKQARAVRRWLNETFRNHPAGAIIVAGMTNDLPFAEEGETQGSALSILSGGEGEVPLRSLWSVIKTQSTQRYTASVDGRAMMLADILVSPSLSARVRSGTVLHFNTDFPAQFGTVPGSAIRSSDHDPLEIRF